MAGCAGAQACTHSSTREQRWIYARVFFSVPVRTFCLCFSTSHAPGPQPHSHPRAWGAPGGLLGVQPSSTRAPPLPGNIGDALSQGPTGKPASHEPSGRLAMVCGVGQDGRQTALQVGHQDGTQGNGKGAQGVGTGRPWDTQSLPRACAAANAHVEPTHSPARWNPRVHYMFSLKR